MDSINIEESLSINRRFNDDLSIYLKSLLCPV
jgi:hypothetical protein